MRTITRVSAFGAALLACQVWAGTASITIDTGKPGPRLNPRMYGIFLEEINHGVDGGLYGELIANRAFENSRPPEGCSLRDGRWRSRQGWDSGFDAEVGEVPRWSLVREGSAEGRMELETTGGLNDNTPYCLRLDVEEPSGGRIGIANEGFWGIGVMKGEKYDLSLYARGAEGFVGPLAVTMEGAAGTPCSDTVKFDGVAASWKPFKATLTGTKSEPKARLVITAGGKGKVWFDFVSLFPRKTFKNRPNGLRADVAQMIADLKPGFVRFPGGCVVEGGNIESAYNWKLTVGPVEERPERWNVWNYRRTHGMGLYEYLQFCEDLSAEPLYVGFAGQSCLGRRPEHVPMEKMGWVVANFLDVVEYANGQANSQWGALRAKSGHPATFGLKLIEIGNENARPEYEQRYRLIHEALKKKHPEIVAIADYAIPDAAYDIVDEHFYGSPSWFISQFNHYDRYDRNAPPVYVGEIAVTSPEGGDLKGNLIAALAEGVFLMGMERNGEVVRMVSYAPLLAHVSGRSGWHGMIYFDSTRVFGTVSYYLWKLFGLNRLDQIVQTEVECEPSKPVVISGGIGVGTWETAAEFKDIRVEKNGEVLYVSDFSKKAEDWKTEGGRWSVQDGAWRQSDRVVGLSYFGDETWSDYTLTLKARKLGGAEGFLIVFGHKGEDKYWWNIGGWGNREHAIEFNRTTVGRHIPGRVELDRWYDIKVELRGARMRCYLDGKLVHDETVPLTKRLFAVAGRDDARGELVLKVINTAPDPVLANLNIAGVGGVASEAQLDVLTSARRDDQNSLAEPQKVVPKTETIANVGLQFAHEFPANSLTVMRLKIK